MQTPRREPTSSPLPPGLIFTTALICGVLAALALQISLSGAGFDLAGLWQSLFSGGAGQLRTTGPWWAVAGLALVTGGGVAATLSRLTLPWRRFRLFRWVAGALIVLLLAHVGHSAAAPPGVSAGMNVGVGLAALGTAALFAALGAHLALRR